MNPATPPIVSGQQLVEDFRSALVSRATAQAAEQEAKHSEASVVQYLASAASGNILNPSALPGSAEQTLTRASLDAHIKKVQAEQIASLSTLQLNQLQSQDQAVYKGRKVTIDVTSPTERPIESIWTDRHTGYRTGEVTKKHLQGTISEVLLDKNALVLKPSYFVHVINPDLQFYVVYVVNPQTTMPMVSITLR